MAKQIKEEFLAKLQENYGYCRKLGKSLSLYEIVDSRIRIYIRYSRVHDGNKTFFGLRESDLNELDGFDSVICFLWDGQIQPLIIPYADYSDVINSTKAADDGQFKVIVYMKEEATELYFAQAGRFNVDGNIGWFSLDNLVDKSRMLLLPDFTHFQVQTMLGAIGTKKGYDIWIPLVDRGRLDWSITSQFECRNNIPSGFDNVSSILQEVDVIWIRRGTNELATLFEVEHTTPVYSGLLRFNDIHLVSPRLKLRFSVVSNDSRRQLFMRQLYRPTFRVSGLSEVCNFLEYRNVFEWHNRTILELT